MKERRALDDATVDYGSRKKAESPPSATPPSAFDADRERFETRGELGRGGMGRVDDAYDHALGRQVAIKHVLSQAEVDLARFEREARITARLEHPGIVPVHDIGRSADGTPYYVMRRFDGEPLSEIVGDKPLVERLRLVPNVLAACDAAAFAHARGVVHRDIKPTNILVGPFGETLLIDWGLARETNASDERGAAVPSSDSNLTRAGTVAGTPGFMSPEQARGETVDARADVFALGATLFYVLAGKLPWHGGSTEMIDHVGAGRPPDWRLMPDEVPPDLRAIVEKAMAATLAERYADAGALAADLRNFTLGNLVLAYQYGWFARLVRFVRKHRAAVSIAAISVVVLAVVAIVLVRRILAERDDANAARALAEMRQQEARAAADRFLVAHARELADVDPTESIAALRLLSKESSQWPQAWAAANAAFYKGVPFGFVGLAEPSVPQIAADSAHAFVYGLTSGRMILLDLVKREPHDLGVFKHIEGIAWFDTSHVIGSTKEGVVVIDVIHQTRRVLPELTGASVYSNREGLAVLWYGGQLFELAAPDGVPRAIDAGVTGFDASLDLKTLIIRRGLHREVWRGGKTYALPDLVPGRDPSYAIRDTALASLDNRDVRIWDLVNDTLVPRGEWTQPIGTNSIMWAEDNFYSASSAGLRRVETPDALAVSIETTTYVQTRKGILLGAQDGGLWIRDSAGLFKLGRRHARYMRLDQSIDGRFALATTQSGEALVWDLQPLRPSSYRVPGDENVVALTGGALWTQNPATGYRRIDLATGVSELQIKVSMMLGTFYASFDGHVVAALDHSRAILVMGEESKPGIADSDVATFGVAEHGVVYGKVNGELWRWEPGRQQAKLATLSARPAIIVVASGRVLAVAGEGDVFVIDSNTGAEHHLRLAARIDEVAIDRFGNAWLIAEGGKPYRWALGAATAVPIETPEPVDGVQSWFNGAVFHNPRSMMVFDGETSHVIAKSSRFMGGIDADVFATVDMQGALSVVDLVSGASFDLPLMIQSGDSLVSPPGQVGFVHWIGNHGYKIVGAWKLSVPRDPAELRAWLATITNAKPVPNSEAVAWP